MMTTTIFCIMFVDLDKFYVPLDWHDGEYQVQNRTFTIVIELVINIGTYLTLVVMIC